MATDGGFEWDAGKARRNIRKHGVLFEEASTVFDDASAITAEDTSHSRTERRQVTIGRSIRGRLLVVAHTARGNRIRIISARRATDTEAGTHG